MWRTGGSRHLPPGRTCSFSSGCCNGWWNCIWETLKFHFGFWGAIALIGVLTVGITALTASTGGAGTAGLTALVTSALATTAGGVGGTVAVVGGAGLIGTLVGGIAKCI